MLRRELLTFVALVILHLLASGFAALLIIAAGESPGGGWFATLLWTVFFFPLILLDLAGVEINPFDNPQLLPAHSACWIAIVYSLWMAGQTIYCRYAASPQRESISAKALE